MKLHIITLAAFLLILGTVNLPADNKKAFDPPRATHAKTYPAHEAHDDEKVSVAIDPFDLADKAAIFKVNYKENGLLPVRVIISNDGDKPVMLNDLSIQFITVNRQKLEPADKDDLYRRLARAGKTPGKQQGPQLPIPLPKRGQKPAVSNETLAEIDAAQFYTFPVEPHSIHSGFVFFDVAGLDNPEAGAHVYLSGMKVDSKELFYFDIPLEKYLSYRPGK
ncbi:MAG TPA: hypothetical protein VG649_14875 [Candidatus Angelobacter sp.]|nr:hypothetical protein [Candidatus Angelobacter sp.]